MLLNLPPLVRGAVAVLPPLAVLLVAYGPYDGFFDDRSVFVYALGGLALGLVVSVFDILLLVDPNGVLFFLLGSPILAQLGKAVGLNLRRWQGKPASVFNGGAMGAGVGAMVVLAYAQSLVQVADLWTSGLVVLALGVGMSLTQYATGLVVGDGVARGRALRSVVPAVVATLPVAVVVNEYVHGYHPFWAAVSLVYGLLAAFVASRALLPRGLTEDDRRNLRRRIRRARREQGTEAEVEAADGEGGAPGDAGGEVEVGRDA